MSGVMCLHALQACTHCDADDDELGVDERDKALQQRGGGGAGRGVGLCSGGHGCRQLAAMAACSKGCLQRG